MRKTITVVVVTLAFLISATGVFAAPRDKKGPSEQAYKHASEQARFKDADKIAKRAQKEAQIAQREAERQTKRAQKEAERETQKLKKGLGQ